jgi:hypothetical protein
VVGGGGIGQGGLYVSEGDGRWKKEDVREVYY